MDRDARIVRRALLAGLLTWTLLAAALLVPVVVSGLGGRAGLTVVMLALCFGAAVTSGWLVLALVLDLFADEQVGWRRLTWTVSVVLFTLASPMLVLGAQGPR